MIQEQQIPIDIALSLDTIDTTLESCCRVSVLTDEGWWGDFMSDYPIGNKLSSFKRSKATKSTAQAMRDEVARSLEWLRSQERAKSIAIEGDFTMKVLIDEVRYEL